MPIRLPVLTIPAGVIAPAGNPNFIGYHGKSNAAAASVLAGGNRGLLLGGGELGDGLYVTSNQAEAALYAQRREGNNNPGRVLNVFCNGALAVDAGEICDPAAYPNPAGMNCPPIIPANLLALPFLQHADIPAQIKIHAARLADLEFT
jgi:hypothetical protein